MSGVGRMGFLAEGAIVIRKNSSNRGKDDIALNRNPIVCRATKVSIQTSVYSNQQALEELLNRWHSFI